MSTEPKHGGKREGAGRKPGPEPPMRSHTIRFPDDLWSYCQGKGGGDAAKYLRQLTRLDIMREALMDNPSQPE